MTIRRITDFPYLVFITAYKEELIINELNLIRDFFNKKTEELISRFYSEIVYPLNGLNAFSQDIINESTDDINSIKGNKGAGFKIIASEIRKLAQETDEAITRLN